MATSRKANHNDANDRIEIIRTNGTLYIVVIKYIVASDYSVANYCDYMWMCVTCKLCICFLVYNTLYMCFSEDCNVKSVSTPLLILISCGWVEIINSGLK